MTLVQLRSLARAMIPGAKVSVVPDPTLDLLINAGVRDISAFTICMKSNKKFDAAADVGEYNLSEELGNYLTMDKSGLWWNNGTIFVPVYPRTLKWLDENLRNWRDRDSGNPQYYSVEADILTVVPAPDTTLVEGFWLYYGKNPTPMTEDGHYSFSGTTTEFTHLSIFDMAIIRYVKWQIDPMLNKDQDANLSKQEYEQERMEKQAILYRRKDLAHSSDVRLQGPKIG